MPGWRPQPPNARLGIGGKPRSAFDSGGAPPAMREAISLACAVASEVVREGRGRPWKAGEGGRRWEMVGDGGSPHLSSRVGGGVLVEEQYRVCHVKVVAGASDDKYGRHLPLGPQRANPGDKRPYGLLVRSDEGLHPRVAYHEVGC